MCMCLYIKADNILIYSKNKVNFCIEDCHYFIRLPLLIVIPRSRSELFAKVFRREGGKQQLQTMD